MNRKHTDHQHIFFYKLRPVSRLELAEMVLYFQVGLGKKGWFRQSRVLGLIYHQSNGSQQTVKTGLNQLP